MRPQLLAEGIAMPNRIQPFIGLLGADMLQLALIKGHYNRKIPDRFFGVGFEAPLNKKKVLAPAFTEGQYNFLVFKSTKPDLEEFLLEITQSMKKAGSNLSAVHIDSTPLLKKKHIQQLRDEFPQISIAVTLKKGVEWHRENYDAVIIHKGSMCPREVFGIIAGVKKDYPSLGIILQGEYNPENTDRKLREIIDIFPDISIISHLNPFGPQMALGFLDDVAILLEEIASSVASRV